MSSSIDRPSRSRPAAPASGASGEPQFDAQRLDVYQVALEFQVLSATLLPRRGQAGLRDQLDRASASIVLCIAEGAGRSSRPDKGRFYGMARGSATECAAVIDIALARRLCSEPAGAAARALLIRIVQMLTKLIARMATRRDWPRESDGTVVSSAGGSGRGPGATPSPGSRPW